MSECNVRPATRGDLAALGPIGVAADERYRQTRYAVFLDGDTIPLDVASRAIDAGRLIVAEVDGVVVGWLFATRLGAEVCLGQVSVLPSFGRLGIGTSLLRALVERSRAAGEGSIVLNTQADVPWNMPWYARHGFVTVPPGEWTHEMRALVEVQRADGMDWSARVHMRLSLSDEVAT